MSSLALYRRYRPETFAEVIGQEHVTDPLQQALRNNRVNHAYLFSGPRGCGKTTSARILARCLNCERGPTPAPCGECQSCRDLARNGPGSIDVIEIDAASHGGVDDARELREKAFFGPASSRYKIYIVDEAHMVTSAGFNALLKVVEEPPEHLKFIFATTEPEKVIGTIRSRTHHYPFRLVPPGTLREHLSAVCAREEIAVDEAVLPLAVRAGAGSVRDSMSVMDQLLAGADSGGVTYAMATALLGYTDSALLDEVVDAFAAGDGAAAFEVVDRVIEGGHDPRRFVADLLERLRDLVILAAVPEAVEKGLVEAPEEVVDRMRAQASVFGAAELSRAADLVNAGLTEMRGATSPRLQLELICARVLLPAAYGDERATQARLDRLERGAAFAGGGAGGAAGAGVEGPSMAAPVPPAAPGAVAPSPGVSGAAPEGPGPGGAGPVQGGPVQGGPPQGGPGAPVESGPGRGAGHRPGAWPGGGVNGANGGTGADGSGAPVEEPGQSGRPGAWPGGTGAADDGRSAGHRPGAWPGAQRGSGGGPASGGPVSGGPGGPGGVSGGPSGGPASAAGPGVGAGAAGAPDGVAAGGDPGEGAARVRQMWPQILEAVKNRRRFTWILLSQNAQVAGFDGTTLQLGFPNPGARDSFANSGSDEVLRQALGDALQVRWQVEAIVDPSAGGSGPGGGPAPSSGGGGGWGGGGGGFGAPTGPGAQAPAAPPPSGPAQGESGGPSGGAGEARQALATAQSAGPSGGAAPGGAASVPGPARTAAAGRPSGGYEADGQSAPSSAASGGAGAEYPGTSADLEDDMPTADDPDLDESVLSGHDLIVRELGATVVEELHHD
ncbi:DNA polymerase III subunit gamma and tau [Streptomyces sp. AJS327]|uniref:DNA polymerase III subunit gamma and tau n=1 Tax=Streptomyces sp. AJS327 TaxID=2545265 RepID=UPI0015DEDD73|nr:DNA polymerase III subunit gamma and tau [Streptomyces sp. AJS327]MBA0052640.1 DNA polymerase III subunit gamma and tau [Streptomyces sp. AJS327]